MVVILTYGRSYIYSQKPYWFTLLLDGLVRKLEELEKTAELYKGKLFFTTAVELTDGL